MTIITYDECEAKIIELRQQLAKAQDHIEYLVLRDATWKMIDIKNKQQLADSQEQVTLLREILLNLHWMDTNPAIRKALADTKPKP